MTKIILGSLGLFLGAVIGWVGLLWNFYLGDWGEKRKVILSAIIFIFGGIISIASFIWLGGWIAVTILLVFALLVWLQIIFAGKK